MFTGIIQAVAPIVGVTTAPRASGADAAAHRLDVELGPLAEGLALGASVAINGACLTLSEQRRTICAFDVVPETWRRTTLNRLRSGDRVHVERALRVGDALDGHFVQGHVDGVGQVERLERTAGEVKLWVRTDPDLMQYIVPKGSVALDGTSLTIVDAAGGRFSVALVPTTLRCTLLGERRAGDHINIETDILARLVIGRLLGKGAGSSGRDDAGGLSWDHLAAGGYLS